MWERIWTRQTLAKNAGWRGWPTGWYPRSPDLIRWISFVGTSQESYFSSPSYNNRRYDDRNSGNYGNGRRQHNTTCSREYRAAHCLPPWNGDRPLRSPVITMSRQWYDLFTPCAFDRGAYPENCSFFPPPFFFSKNNDTNIWCGSYPKEVVLKKCNFISLCMY